MKIVDKNIKNEFFYNENEVHKILTKISEDLLIIGNLKTNTFKYPKEIADLLGVSSQVVKKPLEYWKKIILEEDWHKFYNAKEKSLSKEDNFVQTDFRIKYKNDRIIWLNCIGDTVKDENGLPSTFVGIITIHRKNNKIDSVTNLPVVNEFFKDLKSKIESLPKKLNLIIIGLNNFKRINEFYGRGIGDIILKKMAELIIINFPKNSKIYKLDGTDFGIIVENMSNEDIVTIYENIKFQFIKNKIINKYENILSISAGVAAYSNNSKTFQEIYQHTKYARGYSKYKTNSLVFFNQKLFDLRKRYLKILFYLKKDIDEGFKNFNLVFQPQVVSSNKNIKGVEVLLRWKCKEYGNVSPLEFIPILEENNLIIIVGKWILKKALEVYNLEWKKYNPDLLISINVSFIQITDKNFLKDIKEVVNKSGVNPKNIVLELTESCLVNNIEYIQNIYKSLKDLGIKMALDDFGSGYSSLGILKEFPADIIKIDRIFIKDILNNEFNSKVIQFITKICHTINMKVCVEGVETKEEYELVNSFGVDYIQGYYFGKPVSKEEIAEKI